MCIRLEANPIPTMTHHEAQSGYDVPIFGLNNGEFTQIQVTALICIICSLIAALCVIIVSFKDQSQVATSFYDRRPIERFFVYLAVCDILFGSCHCMDHLHLLITRAHPTPKSLCTFYAFTVNAFILGQNLMVNAVAVNTFVLMQFKKKIHFGAYDWKLLLWVFGLPLVVSLVAATLGVFGPAGQFCFFDEVVGKVAELLCSTIPLLAIMTMNTIMYAITWITIRTEEQKLFTTRTDNFASTTSSQRVKRASHSAAKHIVIFIAIFTIQWLPMAEYGVWQISGGSPVPILLIKFLTSFSNVGGILNGFAFLVVRGKSLSLGPKHEVVRNKEAGVSVELQYID